ncbi:MAG: DUF885 domain-containing protein [Chloroflexi bacterium]|nr:DUF885 domain-containing protein [Chloroflexota bacterium]
MPTVSEISSRYIDEVAALDPVRGERWGVPNDGTRLTDYSPEGVAAMADLLRKTIQDLDAAAPTSEPERLGKGFLADWTAGELGVIEAGERERMLSNIVGPAASTRSVFDLMDKSTPEAWEKIAARLGAVRGSMAGYRASLEAGLANGRAAARRQAIVVADQCVTWAGSGTDEGWFGSLVAGAEGIDDKLRTSLNAAAKQAAESYADLATWLRGTYAARASESDASGDERYRVWAEYLLGTDLDLDEAYGWGWEELARLEEQKDVECEKILPGAGFDAVRDLLINDPGRSIHGVDAYRSWLQYVTDEAIDGLSGREFDIPAAISRCEVRIPPEGSAAAAYYTSPSEDLTRPGRTWFPTVGRQRFPTWDEVSTVYHEAVPGHHLQNATIHLVPLTRAHKLGFMSAHGEGWALYAERLMDELGWFRTPETRLGFLCAHAFRAARVVVDIGLHTGRTIPKGWPGAGEAWTYERAIDFIVRAGGMDRDKAESEVLRYLSWPSQATAYKLGERTWLAGRAAASAAASTAGRTLDRRAWHAGALALGPLGLRRLGAELASA